MYTAESKNSTNAELPFVELFFVEVNLIQQGIKWLGQDLLFIRETGYEHFGCFI